MSERSERVTISVDDRGIADVRMNRPDKRNALDGAMFRGLADAGEQIKADPSVRVVVLSGEGASFCAGLDFSSFQSMADGDGASTERPARSSEDAPSDLTPGGITHLGQQVAWVWQEVTVPVIAAVHGHALGGGIQIALGADIRFVHPETKLSVREVHWGLVPDMTGTLFLSRLVGPDVAKELVFTARIFSGAEAGELGIATHVSETPLDDAMVLAAEIAGRSPDAVRGAKALINCLANSDAAEQFALEREVIGNLIGSPNQVEAIAANFQNRSPSFTTTT
ncbi:MAG: crotonase/enoyl-CoA hydratase family protein [Desertimonas sp.]